MHAERRQGGWHARGGVTSPAARSALETAGVAVAAGALYLPFMSIQYNPNGVNEAISVELGGASLLSPNHMAYRPLGRVLWAAAVELGFDGGSLPILQLLSALSGVLAVTLAFVAFRSVARHTGSAAIGAAFLATSCYFWASSVDAFYMPLAAALAAAALAVAVARPPTAPTVAAASVLTAAAILVWQANLFLVVPIGVCFLAASARERVAAGLVRSVSYALLTLVLTAASYVAVAVAVFDRRTPAAVLDWFSNYAGARLPQWGTWGLERIVDAARSGVDSLVALRTVGGARRLFEPETTGVSVLLAAALASLVVLVGASGRAVLKARDDRPQRLGAVLWLGLGYASFLPFLIWWDPFEPRWFVVPNLFLAGAVAVALGGAGAGRRWRLTAAACVAVIALSTFTVAILPQHTETSLRQRRAACVADHLGDGDVFIATDWRWNAYLTYFHGVRVVSTIGLAPRLEGPAAVVDRVRSTVARARAAGANAYMVDPGFYPRWHMVWLEAQTGLTRQALESLGGEPAFECEGVPLLVLGGSPPRSGAPRP